MRRSLFLLAALLLAPIGAAAQAPAVGTHGADAPTTRVARAASPIRLDGRLDDAAWAAAEATTSFTQYDPDEGQPGSEATEVRVLYDDEALYVGVRLHDRGRVSTRLGRRDMDLGDSDWFGLVIDSYHDHQTAFSLDINPSGVRRDATKTDQGDDLSWEAVWEAEASVDSGGWSAEYRIPFSQLRFNPRETTWGILFERIIGRRGEYAVSAFTPRSERGGIARYGHLAGLDDVRTGKRLEVLPYTVARAEHVDPGENPFRGDREYGMSAGVDLKYRLNTNLTLDATLNPDFGQVEVDPAVVNLTAFETVFQEKRPFFVEGSEIFAFGPGSLPAGGSPFYSRRIGGRFSPLGPPSPLADVPGETGILGAAKLSGKTAGGWSIGLLDAVTAREEARFRDGSGDHSLVVEPLTNFFVGRLRRDLRGGQSYLGGALTAVNRDLETDALREVLPGAAFTGGLDLKHEFARRQWVLTGFASASHVRGDSLALQRVQRRPWHYFQRPDADHLELDSAARSLTGASAELRVRKQAGEHWRVSVGAGTITPGYEITDLGSQRRADRFDLDGAIAYLQQRPGKVFRSWNVEAGLRREWNYDGDHIFTSGNLEWSAQLLSFWEGDLSFGWSPRAFDDRLTRGGPMAVRPGNWRASAEVESDFRRPLTGYAGAFYEDNDEGGWVLESWAGVQIKSSARWNLSVGPGFGRSLSPAQYVATVADASPAALFGRRYLFSELRQTTVSVETRFNYTFNPELTLEVYAQPFVSGVDFGDTRYLVAPRTFDFARDTTSGVQGTDFNVRSLRGNAVLRWEWRPGSTLYVAWQQSRESVEEEVGDFRFGRDRAALFDAAPDNVLVVKVSYWLNP